MKHIAKSTPMYISSKVAVELMRRAEEVGANPNDIVVRSRIPYTLAAVNRSGGLSLTRPEFACLYRECMLALERHASRADGREILKVSEFQMMCRAIITCGTLGEVIGRASEFGEMLGGRVARLGLHERAGMAQFTMNFSGRRCTSSALLIDLQGLSNLYRLFSWLIGRAISLDAVEMAYPEAMRDIIVVEMFPIPIVLGVAENSISFPKDYLTQPVVKTDRHLEELLRVFPHDLVPPYFTPNRMAEHVKLVFSVAIMKQQALPTTDMLAVLFGHSATTFRRRLSQEGTSISKLRKECMKEVATALMRQTSYTNEQIASRLGFSDTDSFRKAFRKWTSLPPSAYRRRNHASHDWRFSG